MDTDIDILGLKTGLSIFIAMTISKALKLQYPFFVALGIIMPLQKTAASSFKAGKKRMIGTIAGALIGVVFAYIKLGNPLLCGIGIAIIIYLLNLIKLGEAAPIAGIVFIAIMVNLNGKEPVYYSLERILDTFIGVCVSLTVSYLISPINYRKKIFSRLKDLKKEVLYFIKEAVCLGNAVNMSNFLKDTTSLENKINLSIKRFNNNLPRRRELENARSVIGLYKNIYDHLKLISSLEYTLCLNNKNYEELKKILNNGIIKPGTCKNVEIATVFNYHVSKIIYDLNTLNAYMKNLPV